MSMSNVNQTISVTDREGSFQLKKKKAFPTFKRSASRIYRPLMIQLTEAGMCGSTRQILKSFYFNKEMSYNSSNISHHPFYILPHITLQGQRISIAKKGPWSLLQGSSLQTHTHWRNWASS